MDVVIVPLVNQDAKVGALLELLDRRERSGLVVHQFLEGTQQYRLLYAGPLIEARRENVPTVNQVPGGHTVLVVDDAIARSFGLDLVRPRFTWTQYETMLDRHGVQYALVGETSDAAMVVTRQEDADRDPRGGHVPVRRTEVGTRSPSRGCRSATRARDGRSAAARTPPSRPTRDDGMLTAVLDRLTSLTSKAFIIGAFVPVLAFAFLNGVVLYLGFGWFRAWAEPQISVAARTFDVVATLVGLAVVAYVLSSLSAFLQQVLEGEHLWHRSRLPDRLRQAQLRSYLKLRGQYREARDAAVRTAMRQARVDGPAAGGGRAGHRTAPRPQRLRRPGRTGTGRVGRAAPAP